MKNQDSIRLFKKNRETDGTVQEHLTKDETSSSEQQFSDLVITPLEIKDKGISLQPNAKQTILPPIISKIIQEVLKKLISRR